ncbi:vanillate O-demethylase oxidoreductase VanB [bacterium]|nr:MAG: vanillate O-demethylase oxidoreductase VanB [bacterium]
MTTSADRIEKRVLLRAPRDRVWRAISDAQQFGAWFGVEFESGFVAGTRVIGRIAPTKVDPNIAQAQEPYSGMPFEFHIDRIEPMRLFSFRWHPYAIETNVDYSAEPMTLVVFTLEDAGGDTMVTITESGFDTIPLARRAEAFEANDEGWTAQAQLIERYLALPAE